MAARKRRYPVAGDGIAQPFAHHHSVAIVVTMVRQAAEHEQLRGHGGAILPHCLEVLRTAQTQVFG